MQRRKWMITGGAILVVGMALAAQQTATQSDRSGDQEKISKLPWAPGSDLPMSEFESSERPAARPAQ
jgi:hypothetical protein